jgi:endonuclease-3
MDALLSLYPDSACELVFASDFQLLIAVILSAQCTDQQVNRVTEKLYARFPDARALAEADLEEIKAIIKPTGYFNAKANNIQNCARMLITKYGGKVPQSVEELTVLPGVGRKTANVVLGVLHNIPGWSVDTHVQRLSKRFGFTREEDPLKIETDLQELFPGQDWSKLSITIIWHGRRLCYARKPACGECPLQSFCPSSEV